MFFGSLSLTRALSDNIKCVELLQPATGGCLAHRAGLLNQRTRLAASVKGVI